MSAFSFLTCIRGYFPKRRERWDEPEDFDGGTKEIDQWDEAENFSPKGKEENGITLTCSVFTENM